MCVRLRNRFYLVLGMRLAFRAEQERTAIRTSAEHRKGGAARLTGAALIRLLAGIVAVRKHSVFGVGDHVIW